MEIYVLHVLNTDFDAGGLIIVFVDSYIILVLKRNWDTIILLVSSTVTAEADY